MSGEIFFDLTTAGFLPGYPFVGGPGRAVFDADTRAFLRIEPLGGVHPGADPPVQAEQAPIDTTTTTIQGG